MERLVSMIKKNKHLLTAKAIRENIELEDKYILKKLFTSMENDLISSTK